MLLPPFFHLLSEILAFALFLPSQTLSKGLDLSGPGSFILTILSVSKSLPPAHLPESVSPSFHLPFPRVQAAFSSPGPPHCLARSPALAPSLVLGSRSTSGSLAASPFLPQTATALCEPWLLFLPLISSPCLPAGLFLSHCWTLWPASGHHCETPCHLEA